jgi:ankyrin repeat protein
MEGIHRAAQEGNEGEVTRLLDEDPTLLERHDDEGETPLAVAAARGQLGVARLLVQRGANIEDQGWRRTALHYAAEEGHEEVVAFLLGLGAQANVKHGWRKTPFILACENGHLGVVQMLVTHTGLHGLEDRDLNEKTALHHAAVNGHGEVVAFLLGKGAQASTRDQHKSTPLICACEISGLDVVRMLVQHTGGEGLDARNEDYGWTALHGAAFYGREEVVKFLLLAGADSSITDNEGRTAEEIATQEQYRYQDGYGERRYNCARCVAVFKVSEPTCG